MKTLSLIALMGLLCLSVKAQDKITDTIPKIDGIYSYQSVVTLDSTYKKDFLYKNAKIFFVDNFRSANDVIQYDNKEDAKIIGKGNLTVSDKNLIGEFKWVVDLSTEITCKGGKYRYRIYDLSITETKYGAYNQTYITNWTIDELLAANRKGNVKRVTARLYNKMIDALKTHIASLEISMAKKDALSKNDF